MLRKNSRVLDAADPQEEIDLFFMQLAFALAARHWQHGAGMEGEGGLFGHNVAAVLVDKRHRPVAWARNASKSARDLTEHAEVRLVRGAIGAQEGTDLHKHTVYTTLEPCAMCAGMMTMTNVRRVMFGMRDAVFGEVFAKLDPYPIRVESSQSTLPLVQDLDAAFSQSDYDAPAVWLLRSDDAAQRVEQGARELIGLAPKFPENAPVLDAVLAFLAEPPEESRA